MNSSNQNETPPDFKAPLVLNDLTIGNFFKENLPKLLNYIYSKGLKANADDILQEAYLAFWIKLQEEDILNPRAYLTKIMMNKVSEYCRERKKNMGLLQSIDNNELLCQNAITSNSYLLNEIAIARQERYKNLLNIIENHLTYEQREIIKLKFFENRSTKEISELMSKSEEAIRASLSRGKKKIISLMNPN